MVAVDEDTIVTGSSDGLLRLISIQPNRLLGVIGEHADFPVEALRLSHDRKFVASASHDNKIKLWNIAYLFEDDQEERPMDVDEEDPAPAEEEGEEERSGDSSSGSEDDSDDAPRGPGSKLKARNPSKRSRKAGFYAGLE